MTYPPTSGHSPPHSGPTSPPSSSDGHHPHGHLNGNAYILLGEMLGHVRHILYRVSTIDGQITIVRETQEDHGNRLAKIERDREADAADPIPKWEKVAKRHAVWIIPTGALTATGSWELALKLLAALK